MLDNKLWLKAEQNNNLCSLLIFILLWKVTRMPDEPDVERSVEPLKELVLYVTYTYKISTTFSSSFFTVIVVTVT